MMGLKISVASVAAGIFMATLTGTACADDDNAKNFDCPSAANIFIQDHRYLESGTFKPPANLLAVNEGDATKQQADVIPADEFQPPLISGRKVHQYLGLSTVALAGLTMLAAPDNECEQSCTSQSEPRQTSGTTHTRLARATAAMAVATVVTGLIYHWDDFHLEDGFADPDNQHVMLAGAGTLLMLYAVNKSAHSSVPTSHAGIAELGAVTMLFAIKLTW
jgi:hypothetical protein